MTIYDESIIPPWAEIGEQTKNFVYVIVRPGYVVIDQVQELFDIGLQVCGMANIDYAQVTLCCLKMER